MCKGKRGKTKEGKENFEMKTTNGVDIVSVNNELCCDER